MSDTKNGLKLSLKPLFTSGLPAFEACITNISSEAVTFCKYHLEHRLLSRMNADGYEVFVFGRTPRPALNAEDFTVLAPGQELKCNLSFAEGPYEWMWGGSRPPTVQQGSGLKAFPAGTYTFIGHVGDYINFSTAAPGTSGASERVKILTEVEQKQSPPQNCWEGDLVAECVVEVTD